MSRQINQPVQSIKLTNVATVRLTVQGQRFEVACYKNKVLDYRAGLETDLSEVLQTTGHRHVFTSVAKGQLAAASDLQQCFGTNATQEEIALRILKQGQSLQVSEVERAQLYDQTLTQICTWLATNCHHPGTGKPYTVSQIKHALTSSTANTATTATAANNNNSTSTTSNGGGGTANPSATASDRGHPSSSNKGKKKKNKKQQQQQQQQEAPRHEPQPQQPFFSVQPHKPIKQQYLAALRYLQMADILPIQRAAMRLQWEYPVEQQTAVTETLRALDIAATATVTTTTTTRDDNKNYNTNNTTTVVENAENEEVADTTTATASSHHPTQTMILTVDPSLYRPLQERATSRVPGSHLEILQQQVFQASTSSVSSTQVQQQQQQPQPLSGSAKTTAGKATTEEEEKPATGPGGSDSTDDDDDDDNHSVPSSSSSSSGIHRLATTSRQNQRNAKKKQQRKAQRQLQQQRRAEFSSSSSSQDEDEPGVASLPFPSPPLPGGSTSTTTPATAPLLPAVPGMKTCNTCVGAANAFATAAAYRAHFRSDWHRYNQKLKLQGAAAIALEEFQQCDAESFFASTTASD